MLNYQRVWYEASPFMQFIDFSKIPDGKELQASPSLRLNLVASFADDPQLGEKDGSEDRFLNPAFGDIWGIYWEYPLVI